MSAPRRTGGDINILAMLDGQVSRPLLRRLKARPALLWYGGAGVLAAGLVGTLAWLAQGVGNGTPATPAVPVLADAAPSAAATMPSAAAVEAARTADAEYVVAAAVTPQAAPPLLPAAPEVRQPAREAHHREPAVRAPATARTAVHPKPIRRGVLGPVRTVPAAAPVDADVAWIYAIMQHEANRQGPPEPSCAPKPCVLPAPER